jgi:hypothetical protein
MSEKITNNEIQEKLASEVNLPASRKIYVETNGNTVNENGHNLRVPFREIALSPTYDREAKANAYSRNGIQQYLLLNLQNETLEDYREPSEDGYQFKRTLRKGDICSLVEFSDIEINVDDLF